MKENESELSAKYLNGKIKKAENFEPTKHIIPGNVLFFTYNPIGNDPYDKCPLSLVISDKGNKFLGINFHWAPKSLREKILKEFMKANFINLKNSLPPKFPEKLPEPLYRMISPIFRLYLKNRVNKKIAVIPSSEIGYVINLKAEKFIGISSEQAYKHYFVKQQKSKSLFNF